MSTQVPVRKDAENELPVPSAWRPVFERIVDAFRADDFGLRSGFPEVRPISPRTKEISEKRVRQYGGRLAKLPAETWDTSVCMWMENCWQVLVDLYVEDAGRSDLVMDVRVYETTSGFKFDLHLVYVP